MKKHENAIKNDKIWSFWLSGTIFGRFWEALAVCGISTIFRSAKSRSKIEKKSEKCDRRRSGHLIDGGSAAEAVVLGTQITAEV